MGKRSACTRGPGDTGEKSAWTTGRETRVGVSLDHRPGDTGERLAWTRGPGDTGERSAWTRGPGDTGERSAWTTGPRSPGAQPLPCGGQVRRPSSLGSRLPPGLPSSARPPANTASVF